MIQLLTRSTFLVSTQTIRLAPVLVLALGVNLLLPHLPRDPYSPRQKVLLLLLLLPPTIIVTSVLIPRLLPPLPHSSLPILPK
jgi:hypothetical protein